MFSRTGISALQLYSIQYCPKGSGYQDPEGTSIKRLQIQLDDATYAALRRRAYADHRSISSVIREELQKALLPQKRRKRLTLKEFRFAGAGRTKQGGLSPVSKRYDEALAEAIREGFREYSV